jgi:A/G-specific adenine glycosylase
LPRSISNALIAWYRKNKRDLPWRHTTDPYAILVSELMLQQTQVATVVPFYERFLERFPDAASLARAKESVAMAHWQGLGYYSRLRNLQRAARVVAEFGWPEDISELPGVGRYTANAVASIAFAEQTACADGNVRRVMSRLEGKSLTLQESEAASGLRMGRFRAGEWNQSVMELGAIICTPRIPNCGNCPVRTECVAFNTETQNEIPVSQEPASTVILNQVYACFVRGRKVGLMLSPKGAWWAGLYVFKCDAVKTKETPHRAVVRLGMESPRHIGSLRHTVTRHKIRVDAFAGDGSPVGIEWFPLDRLDDVPMSAPSRRVVRWLKASR